ncbi:MAG: cytochrome c oxidase subunit II [Legionellales bacterium RIFCSPHIGHO2_12_FULL_35_11]|nr:MAG: cytochrome c oxidase subunit II [Legionellales bacterium RIFCSPHIGHO2_12_FULL_35_11]
MPEKFKIGKMLVAIWALIFTPLIFAADSWQMNMHKGVTPISKDMFGLHMVAIFVCITIGIAVFGVMFYSLYFHRKSKGHKAAAFHGNLKLEIIWTIIPFVILILLAVPATKVLMNMEDTADSDVTVKIVGYQWKWQYQYLDEGISYFSILSTPYAQIHNQEPKNEWYLLEVDKPLVLPTNKKIRFLVTSNDVVHSWWVPELGVKRDAIPGFMHEAWAKIEKPGTYRGQCTELCGVYHGFMPIVVKAVTPEEYKKWVAEQPKIGINNKTLENITSENMSRSELMTLGKDGYEAICSPCHQTNGRGIPPMFPALKDSSVAVGHPISRHIEMILNGVPGTAMQGYAEQLTDKEIAAIATYERNAWGNNTDDEIQPKDVAEIRLKNQIQPKLVSKAKAGRLE